MAQIVQFPRRNKGRVRKSESMFAAGEMALTALDIEAPANMLRLDHFRNIDVFQESTTALLAVCVYSVLSEEQKTDVRKSASFLRSSRRATDRAIAAELIKQLEPKGTGLC